MESNSQTNLEQPEIPMSRADKSRLAKLKNLEKAHIAKIQQSKIKKDLEARMRAKVEQELLHKAWQTEREEKASKIDQRAQRKQMLEYEDDQDSDDEVIYVKPKARVQKVKEIDQSTEDLKKELEMIKQLMKEQQANALITERIKASSQPIDIPKNNSHKKDDEMETYMRRKILNF